MSAAEKLACEWEARHDAAARGRQLDPAAALQRYLNHTRTDEGLRHQVHPAHRSESPAAERARRRDRFADEHPLAATWLRWGEDSR
jgi:hypothetical protein